MKYLIWFVSFLIAAIANVLFSDLDAAYSLATLIFSGNVEGIALLSGLISGIFFITTHIIAYLSAKKMNKNREISKFQKDVMKSGMSTFEYAKSITPEKVISYCDSHIDRPAHIIIEKLDHLPKSKIISRPCADALIEGYTRLMTECSSKITDAEIN